MSGWRASFLEIDVRQRMTIGVANDVAVLAQLLVRVNRPTTVAESGGRSLGTFPGRLLFQPKRSLMPFSLHTDQPS